MSRRWRYGARLLQAAHGRVVAGLLLVTAVLALINIEATPLLGIRNLLFDHYQRLMPRDRTAAPVVVVAIDEKSLQAYGQWPWPRDLVARLVDRLVAEKPLAVGLDILFVEPDRLGPNQLAKRLPQLPPYVLAQATDPDRSLAAALAAGPTVLALTGLDAASQAARLPARSTPVVSRHSDVTAALPAFPAALVSLPLLEKSAAGQGLINAPPDPSLVDPEHGVLRRLPMLARVGNAVVPTLGLEMVRLALGADGIRSEAGSGGAPRIGVGDYSLPTAPDGNLLLHFGHLRGDRYLSAADVLAGRESADNWRGRFVIVGMTAHGLVDRVATPLGERSPGVDIHAQFIESLLTGASLRRPTWMPLLELAALLAGALFLMATVPRLRPAYAAYLGLAVAVAATTAGYAAFAAGRWLFDGATLIILLNPLFITLLGNTLADADRRRRRAEHDLRASREAAARNAGELDAARRIQIGLLPDLPALCATEPRIAVAACLEPAQAVGGDFYDCFTLDADRVCLVIGDVSGKGVPASLFMTVTKVLANALARRAGDLGETLQQVQVELNRSNPEMMFVTVFVAVLDMESGTLHCASAGQDAPLLLHQGNVSPLPMGDGNGPPLCAIDDYPFRAVTLALQPGDLLCLFTDGVSEACDGRSFLGKERLHATLAGHPGSPRAVVETLRQAVRDFEAGHSPADDLTLLALRWDGPAGQPAVPSGR